MKVVLDTNFIVYTLKFKIPLEDELLRILDKKPEIFVLSGTIAELERLINKGKLFERKIANLALRFARAKNIKVLQSEGNVDDALTALNPKQYCIATMDAKLQSMLRKKKFRIISIRQKKYLQIA